MTKIRQAGRYFVAGLMALVVMLLTGAATAAAGDSGRPIDKRWTEALRPLLAMPVQDFGFIRSVYTFGDNHLRAITDKHAWRGMTPPEAVIYLMANPRVAQTAPLMRVMRKEIGEIYGSKFVSLAQYRDAALQEKLVQKIQADETLTKPANELDEKANHLEQLEQDFAIIPRPGDWLSPAHIEHAADARPEDKAIADSWRVLKTAMNENDPKAGAAAARELAERVAASAKAQGIALPRLGMDVFYHEHQPFARSAFFYVLAALAFGGSILVGRRALGWVGFALMALGLAEQVVGITARWMLAGRAPLSNMYESFTFAIAGMILVALVFEAIYRTRLAGLGGAALGFIFMVLAHKAPIFDSQIRPLMPALQSSWLTYHVVTIMLSYSAFALSFFVSLIYLGKDALGGDAATLPLARRLPPLAALDLFNYKIIAVGFPLLTAGIVLGAVWAATAWGRPWGFDPKETWSAITWLIYAIYLHARYLAGWRGRRAAILAIIGFAGVLFTYLGVNYLLPGLHSYA